MILHTINKPSALPLCRDLIAKGDAVILIEDGVYLAGSNLPGNVFTLAIDAAARGVSITAPAAIDHARFVELCAEAEKVCAWF